MIDNDIGIVRKDIGETEVEAKTARGGQKRIGENIAASIWYVVLASIPSSVRSPRNHARNA